MSKPKYSKIKRPQEYVSTEGYAKSIGIKRLVFFFSLLEKALCYIFQRKKVGASRCQTRRGG